MEREKTDSWDNYYARTLELPSPQQTELFLSKIPHDGRVLDFGAGSGRWTAAFIRDRPNLTVDALDQNITQAAQIPADSCGERINASFQEFQPRSATYDGIWSFASLFFLPKSEQATCIHCLTQSLKPKGILSFSMVDDCHTASAAKFYGQSEHSIRDLLAKEGFKILAFKRVDDVQYGNNSLAIPTFFITAQKQ